MEKHHLTSLCPKREGGKCLWCATNALHIAPPITPCVAPPHTLCIAPPHTPCVTLLHTPCVALPHTPCVAPPHIPCVAPPHTPCVAPPRSPCVAPPRTPCVAPPRIPCVAPPHIPCVAHYRLLADGPQHVLIAASSGDISELKRLRDKEGYNPCALTFLNGWTALHEACKAGHVEVVKLLLGGDVAINAKVRTLPSHSHSPHTRIPFILSLPSHLHSLHTFSPLTLSLPSHFPHTPLTYTLPSHSPHTHTPLTLTFPSHTHSPHTHTTLTLTLPSHSSHAHNLLPVGRYPTANTPPSGLLAWSQGCSGSPPVTT